MIKGLEVCIMHCGEAVVEECRQAIWNQQPGPERIYEVVGVSPLNEAYNEYFKRMKLDYCVKVDADTILAPFALQHLHGIFSLADHTKYYSMVGFINDALAGKQSGVRISKVSPELKSLRLPNVIACDRHETRIMRDEHGLRVVTDLQERILGIHKSNWDGLSSVVTTFFNTGQKCLMLGDQKMKLFYRLCKKFVDTGNLEPLIAIVAFSHGMFVHRGQEKSKTYGAKVAKHMMRLASEKHHIIYSLGSDRASDNQGSLGSGNDRATEDSEDLEI